MERLVVALVVVPNLGGQEDFLAVDAAVANRSADARFVSVNAGRVDTAITQFQRPADGLFDFSALVGLIRADAESGHADSIFQRDGVFNRSNHLDCPSSFVPLTDLTDGGVTVLRLADLA